MGTSHKDPTSSSTENANPVDHQTPTPNDDKDVDSAPTPTTYVPTPEELAAAEEHQARRKAQTVPRLKPTTTNKQRSCAISHPHPELGKALLYRGFGTIDDDFAHGVVRQMMAASKRWGDVSEEDLNFLRSIVAGIEPRDQTETLHALLMGLVQMEAVAAAIDIQQAQDCAERESADRRFNRLTRTFITQFEAFKRCRSGASQTVTVQNVSVRDGGQAIVGNVTQSSRPSASEAPSSDPPSQPRSQPSPKPIVEGEQGPLPTREKELGAE